MARDPGSKSASKIKDASSASGKKTKSSSTKKQHEEMSGKRTSKEDSKLSGSTRHQQQRGPATDKKTVATSTTIPAASSSILTREAEVDFPRGAPALEKRKAHAVAPAPPAAEDKGLFDDGLHAAASSEAGPSKTKSSEASSAIKSSKKRKLAEASSLKAAKSKKAAASSTAAVAAAGGAGEAADTFRVEHLSYKRLLPGPTVLLAQIVQILPLELVVSLPSQLMGHVPITNISQAFTKRIEAEAEESEDDDDQESDEDEDEEEEEEENDSDADADGKATATSASSSSTKLPNLDEMFHVGQYLLTSVVNVLPPRATTALAKQTGQTKQRGTDEWRASRRVELSLDPKRVNAGVSVDDCKQNQMVLQACVKSVEDNGYILDTGLPLSGSGSSADQTLTGFVSFKDEKTLRKKDKTLPKHLLTPGNIVTANATKVAGNGRTATLSIFPSDISSAVVSNPPNITALLPGALVDVTVTAVTHSGLNVRFLTYFTGSIDSFHLLPPSSHTYKVGESLKARILWTTPPLGDSPTRFALSALPHIVKLEVRKAPLSPDSAVPSATKDDPEASAPVEQILPIGTFVESVRVIKVEPEWGLLCSIPGTDLLAFVHISHASDLHLTSLASGSAAGSFRIGSVHRGRVIGHSQLDGLIQLSLQQSILERRFMKVSDLRVGELVEDAIVQRLTSDHSALFANIHGSVNGIVWPLHFSDLKLKHPERKFKAGGKVKAKILSVDPEKSRVVLTLRRSLVNSDLPVLQSIADARVGMILHGLVHALLDKGALVELIGGIRAFVSIGEISSENFVTDVKKELTMGQVVKVKILKVDSEASRLTVSIKQAQEGYQPRPAKEGTKDSEKSPEKAKKKEEKAKEPVADVSSIEIGERVSGTITDMHESQIVLSLSKDSLKALLAFTALAKFRSTTVEAVKETLKVGDAVDDLVVVSKNAEKGLIIVGCAAAKKPSLVPSTSRSGISANAEHVFTVDSLSIGQVLEGRVANQTSTGSFILLSQGIRGRVQWTELADDFDTIDLGSFSTGRKVTCCVIGLDVESKKIELSLRKSRIDGNIEAADVRDPALTSVDEVNKGESYRGIVRSIADAGLFVDIGRDLTARVLIKELFDEYVKDWKPRFAVGQVVQGRIIDLDKSKKQLEMSLRKSEKAKRVKKDGETTITFEGLREGQVVDAVVKRVETYGAFLRIQGSNVSGLCHKSEIADDAGADWATSVTVGDSVKAVIIDLNDEKRKISFSMKASKLADAEEEEDDDEDGQNDVMRKLNQLVELQESAENTDEDEGSDDDDLDVKLHSDDDQEEEDEEESENEGPAGKFNGVADGKAQPGPPALPSLKLSAFKWDGQVDNSMDVDGDDDDAAESEAESEASDEAAPKSKKASDRKAILIDDKTGDLDTQAPTSASDFDRLLLASPNSSFLWIQYMSYYLQLSDADKARQIADRAFKTINYREEEERLNVWMALLNLENSVGTEDAFDATFNKAIQANDAKQVYLRTLEVLEQSGKIERTEALFERFVKKFNMSSKAWTLYGQFLLSHDRAADAREILPRSLKSLPQRKHVKTISKFAQMEFKIGEPERGRTIFEGIVDTYPKRLDLWWVYIDQEIRVRNLAGVRALFDRVLNQKLSSKKTKSLLKKWLAFEKQYGDASGQEAVKARAVAYVQQMQQ